MNLTVYVFIITNLLGTSRKSLANLQLSAFSGQLQDPYLLNLTQVGILVSC